MELGEFQRYTMNVEAEIQRHWHPNFFRFHPKERFPRLDSAAAAAVRMGNAWKHVTTAFLLRET